LGFLLDFVENKILPEKSACSSMLLINILSYLLIFDCADVDECKERKACQCPACSCKDTWGSYECSCSGDLLYMRDHDTCISELEIVPPCLFV